tara:strand:+ start:2955 stop:3359 length:405 start_codon:yes stop_codon:yes gene_type:complete
MRYLIFLLSILLFNCSPLQRHNRIVKKFPYVHTVDSVKLIDTVNFYTDVAQIDTVILLSALKDTITIIEDNLRVKVYTVRDSFFLDAKCDTIFMEKIITRTIPVKYYKQSFINKKWIYFIVCLFIALYIFKSKK